MAAGRNHVAIATRDKKVIVIDTSSNEGFQLDCDLDRFLGSRLGQARIHKVFLDPSGKFTLISLAVAADNQPMENLLFVKRIQPLPRLKNHLISAVAWNYPRTNNSESNLNSTGTILIGTTKGLILQAEFVHSDETRFFPLMPGLGQYVKEVFDVGPEVGTITGIEFHQIPSSSPSERSYIIIVSTNNRLYRMVGNVPANVDPPPLHQIFSQNSTNYQDVPGRFNSAKIDFHYPSPNSPPVRFAWLTEPGVMTGEIYNQLSLCRASFESNEDINIIPYDNSKDSEQSLPPSTPLDMSPPFSSMTACFNQKPISVVITNFHVIVLFRHCIRAICILNNAIIYEEYYDNKYGNLLGMCKDPTRDIIWVYFERALFKYRMSNENKNIWKIYLSQKKFDLAKKYSSSDDKNLDRVICEEAQHYFEMKDYEKSAEIFARSKKPYEDVCKMFMEIKCSKALRKYLLIKLDHLDPKQTIQMTITLAWLFEIIVSSISIMKTQPQTDEGVKELDQLYIELDQLLGTREVLDCIAKNSKLFYSIFHNYSESDFVTVAKLIGDYKVVVRHHIEAGDYRKVLDIMKSVKKDEFFYKHGPILMKRIPKEFVDALIEQPSVRLSKIVPVLLHENPLYNKCCETIRYLKYCIDVLKTGSKLIHMYLFELYARYKSEDTLIDYLENESSPDTIEPCFLDLERCSHLCTELKLVRARVKLFSVLGHYDEAIQIALGFDLELAKSIARKAEAEEDQKRLWVAIANHILTNNLDIEVATSLLKECRLLKIEDILPSFPHASIDPFMDAIKQTLQEYKNEIMSFNDDAGTYDTIIEELDGEREALSERYSDIKVEQKCQNCPKNLLSRKCYVFPCGHLLHFDCMINEIISIDPRYEGVEEKLRQSTILEATKTHLSYSRNQNFAINSISSQTTKSVNEIKERLVNELDEIASSECVFCGSLLTIYINKPAPSDLELLSIDDSY